MVPNTHTNKRINLLVLPDMFPRYEGDIYGIFLLDYLKAVESYCNISVLFLQISGERPGLTCEQKQNMTIYRYTISTIKNASHLKKMLLYLNWYRKGKNIGQNLNGIDIIHAHGGTLNGTLAKRIAASRKIPYLITEHTGPFSKITEKRISRLLCKRAMESSHAVLPVSNDLQQQILSSKIIPPKMYVTYNPVNTDLFDINGNPRNHNNFLFAGRLEDYKGALRSVMAFEKIYQRFAGWTFTIIGDGPEKAQIEYYLKRHPALNKRVVLTGKLTKEGIARQMNRADFFVYPSEHETFGIVIAEAMAAGLPVIVGNQTAPQEFVNRELGHLIPPNNIDQIADAIEDMIRNHAAYDSQKIRESVVKKFSLPVFGERLYKIYREFV